MEQEQEKGFTVTDKRSASRETTTETPQPEVTPETSTQTEEPDPTFVHAEQGRGTDSYPPLPEANLLTLIFSLYAHAQISLGLIPDPMTQKQEKDLQQVKYNIDLLDVLKEKTKNNLTQEEEQTLDQILYELRMAYVEANK